MPDTKKEGTSYSKSGKAIAWNVKDQTVNSTSLSKDAVSFTKDGRFAVSFTSEVDVDQIVLMAANLKKLENGLGFGTRLGVRRYSEMMKGLTKGEKRSVSKVTRLDDILKDLEEVGQIFNVIIQHPENKKETTNTELEQLLALKQQLNYHNNIEKDGFLEKVEAHSLLASRMSMLSRLYNEEDVERLKKLFASDLEFFTKHEKLEKEALNAALEILKEQYTASSKLLYEHA
jgi:hypothetical protein